jgi:long-chain acyl-CoA synthetase
MKEGNTTSAYGAKPWLTSYDPHVPAHIDYPPVALSTVLEETARAHPDQPAMIFKGNQIPYQAFNGAVDRFAAALQHLGVRKGDRVAVHSPNCPQFPIAYYAILRIGGIVVPCNPLYTAREMKHQLGDSGAEIIVTLSALYPVIRQIRAQTSLRHVIVARIKTYLPSLLKLLFTLLLERKTGHKVDISADADTEWFTDLLDRAPVKPRPVEIGGQDTAVLMYTGGTTGVSKGAQLTHQNILVNAYQTNVWVNAQAGEHTLTSLPLFHSYGMTMCMNASVLAGATMILIPDPRDTGDVLKNIDRHRPAYYPGVPAMYVAINDHPQVARYDLSSIKTCCSGAAPLPTEVQQRFQEITGSRLIEGYGLSEASPVTHGNPAYGECCIGTIGVPWPDTEAKIVDADAGEEEVDVGQVGELCVRGPQVMSGYWGMPIETANVLQVHAEGGAPWLHTGDLARMDENGYFQIVDRKKDVILGSGGYNIYPREIEEVLYEHPQVREAAAIGIPMEDKGERVKIYIVLKEGETATEEELIAFCKENLAPYKVPRFVEFRDELPKTLVGKVLRRALLEEERDRKTGPNRSSGPA